MTDYILSIWIIAGGILWLLNAGDATMKRDTLSIITFMMLGICSIIGGLKLWP